MAEQAQAQAATSVIVVGAGVFGLSTVLSLLQRQPEVEHITIVDAAASIPNAYGSSVDSSRIVRPDYSNALYTRLADEAQAQWRDQSDGGYGGQGRYAEPGFLLTVDDDETGAAYVKKSYANVTQTYKVQEAGNEAAAAATGARPHVELLQGEAQIRRASGYDRHTAAWGYVNWRAGWADAGKTVEYMRDRIDRASGGRVRWQLGTRVERVTTTDTTGAGVQLVDGRRLTADLVVLAAGAWTGALVDLRGRAIATGQVLAYIAITEAEEAAMRDRPTIMNFSQGMFVIPPRQRTLKIARHAFGYRNPTRVPARNILGLDAAGEDEIEVSLPWNDMPVPREGRGVCRAALRELLPAHMAERPFVKTRVCWYSDTPTGDFIIDWLPGHRGRVFVATGGSGHGFKFAPVIGDRIVDAIHGRLDADLRHSWRWRPSVGDFDGCDDGSRAGRRGMIAQDEARL